MINSRNIQDLTPATRSKALNFLVFCKDVGIDVILTSTFRDNASQAAIYAQGRTAPGKIVTWAQPGHSYHNYKLAFDFVPIVNGKAVWNDLTLWQRCGELAEKAGLEWGGRWKKKDRPHCQNTQGVTIAQLLAGTVNVS